MRKNIIIAIASVASVSVLLIVSFLYNYNLSKRMEKLESQLKKHSSSGRTLSKNQTVTLPKVLYNIVGTIKGKTNTVLTVETFLPTKTVGGKPLQQKEQREVIVSAKTKIVKLVFLENEDKKRIQLKEEPITFEKLKIGDRIEAIANYNIKDQRRFEASQIRVLPRK